ncbi:MAG: tetratricopeptide repeat protein [Opitutaceae bacterium]|nr:tetratricopeptide repeat protein [Verrucomicrobiales bacterium]
MRAASATSESKDFDTAARLHNGRFFSDSEKRFAEFVIKYPESTRRAEAVLYQIEARYKQENFSGAIELADFQQARAGQLADHYLFWQAESFLKTGNLAKAAEYFARVVNEYPLSNRRLVAAYGEALARSRQGERQRVIQLLQATNSAFVILAKQAPQSEAAIDGNLLLIEALFAETRNLEAEQVAVALGRQQLAPANAFRQQDWLCRIRLAAGQLEDALVTSTNALAAAVATGDRRNVGEANFLQAVVLQRLNRIPDSMAAYERNLSVSAGVSTNLQHDSLFGVVGLHIREGRRAEAIARLQSFSVQNPTHTSSDLIYLTLGELSFQEYLAGAASATNGGIPSIVSGYLNQATTNFDRLIAGYPQSTNLGRAYLNKGWCLWMDQRHEESGQAFEAAASVLPASEDQAVARFKAADARFKVNDFTNAITRYTGFLASYQQNERVRNSLFDQALYQLVRANLALGDIKAAEVAVSNIFNAFPNSGYSESSVMLVGQDLIRKFNPASARDLFETFLKLVPGSPIGPKARLAIGRTYVLEGNWPKALSSYDQWLGTYPDSPLVAEAEFLKAQTYFRAGMETNGLQLMTNFVARYPSNALSLYALSRIGDHYFNVEDYSEAEKNYQLVYEKSLSPTSLAYQARFYAGRSAFSRREMKDARKHFEDLLNLLNKDTNSPASLRAETYFALGDTISEQSRSSTNQTADKFGEAITAFTMITRDFPTNSITPKAFGRIGDCYLLSAPDGNDAEALNALNRAASAYSNVLTSAQSDVSTRTQAMIGLGRVAERKGDPQALKQALGWYLKPVFEFDPSGFEQFWVKEAGISAARLCEREGQWEQAVRLYRKLIELFPGLRGSLEDKIENASRELKKSNL